MSDPPIDYLGEIDHLFLLSKLKEAIRKNDSDQILNLWNGDQSIKDIPYFGGLSSEPSNKSQIPIIVDSLAQHFEYIRINLVDTYFNLRVPHWMRCGRSRIFPKIAQYLAYKKICSNILDRLKTQEDCTFDYEIQTTFHNSYTVFLVIKSAPPPRREFKNFLLAYLSDLTKARIDTFGPIWGVGGQLSPICYRKRWMVHMFDLIIEN